MLEPEFSVVTPLVVPMSESWSTLPCKFEFSLVLRAIPRAEKILPAVL